VLFEFVLVVQLRLPEAQRGHFLTQALRGRNQKANRETENSKHLPFSNLPEGGLGLVTNRQGAI